MLEVIHSADILYVSGGDTKQLLETWQETGRGRFVTSLLRAGRLTVCGASAGALVWFDTAFSDYQQYHPKQNGQGTIRPWFYEPISGLGVLKAWGIVHHY
jgi:dipeptidase E